MNADERKKRKNEAAKAYYWANKAAINEKARALRLTKKRSKTGLIKNQELVTFEGFNQRFKELFKLGFSENEIRFMFARHHEPGLYELKKEV